MISICIITKNEEQNLRECLTRLSPYDFEIIVIDTGSSDNSKSVAKSFTPYVYDFKWCDDFSAARNFAISKATQKFILMIDTDEFIESLNKELLLELIEKNPLSVGVIHRKDPFFYGDSLMSNEYIERIFPKDLYHYSGAIHEQVTPINPSIVPLTEHGNIQTYMAPICILHQGYNYEQAQQTKAKRNLSLLLKEYSHNKDDIYILYQIAKSYYSIHDYQNSLLYFQEAFDHDIDIQRIYIQKMIVLYGYALLETKQYSKCLVLESYYDNLCTNADYMFLLGLTYMHNARFDDAIFAFLCATQTKNHHIDGVNSYRAFYNIGVIYECLNQNNMAIEYYKKAGDFSPALEGISRLTLNL